MLYSSTPTAENQAINKASKISKMIVDILAGSIVFLFMYTALSKLLDLNLFIGQINNQPFPNWMTPYIATLVLLVEVSIVVFLIWQKMKKTGFILSIITMSIFSIYTILVLLKVFDRVPCSCGGVIKQLSWPQHMFFNLAYLLISIVGLVLYNKQKQSLS